MPLKSLSMLRFITGLLACTSLAGAVTAAGAQGRPPIAWMQGLLPQVNSLAWSPDGSLLAQGTSASGEVRVFRSSTGELVETLYVSPCQDIYSVAFSPDGKEIAAGGYTSQNAGAVMLWRVSDGALMHNFPTTAQDTYSVAFSPDGSALVSAGAYAGSSGGTVGGIELWSVAAGTLTAAATTPAYTLYSVAYAPNAKSMVAGGYAVSSTGTATGFVALLDPATGAFVKNVGTKATWVQSVAFSPDSKSIAIGGADVQQGLAELRSASTGSVSLVVHAAATSAIQGVSFTPSGATMIVAGYRSVNSTQTVLLDLVKVAGGQGTMLSAGAGYANTAVSSPNGKFVASGGSALQVWKVATGALVTTFPTPAKPVQYAAAFSSDGKWLASGGSTASGGIVQLWKAATGAPVRRLTAGSDWVETTVAFSPDATLLASEGTVLGSPSDTATIHVWRVSDGALLQTINAGTPNSGVYSVCFTPDGKTLIASGTPAGVGAQSNGAVLQTWDTKTWHSQGTYPLGMSSSGPLCLATGGKQLAVAGAVYSSSTQTYTWVVELVQMPAGKVVSTLAAGTTFYDMQYSPDGSKLVCAGYLYNSSTFSWSPVVQVYNSAAGALITTVTPKGSQAISAAYSPDGLCLFVGSDQVLQVYSAANYGLLQTYDQETEGAAGSVAFTPDGVAVAYTRSGDGVVVVAKNAFLQMPHVARVDLSTSAVTGGTTVTATVLFTGPVPLAGGSMTVSSNSSAASVPSSVSLTPGARSVTFQVTTTSVATQAKAKIKAALGNSSGSVTLTINP